MPARWRHLHGSFNRSRGISSQTWICASCSYGNEKEANWISDENKAQNGNNAFHQDSVNISRKNIFKVSLGDSSQVIRKFWSSMSPPAQLSETTAYLSVRKYNVFAKEAMISQCRKAGLELGRFRHAAFSTEKNQKSRSCLTSEGPERQKRKASGSMINFTASWKTKRAQKL